MLYRLLGILLIIGSSLVFSIQIERGAKEAAPAMAVSQAVAGSASPQMGIFDNSQFKLGTEVEKGGVRLVDGTIMRVYKVKQTGAWVKQPFYSTESEIATFWTNPKVKVGQSSAVAKNAQGEKVPVQAKLTKVKQGYVHVLSTGQAPVTSIEQRVELLVPLTFMESFNVRGAFAHHILPSSISVAQIDWSNEPISLMIKPKLGTGYVLTQPQEVKW
ncbi:MAG: hypothetical protein ACRC5C_14455 [Bacilli bacterium]